MIAGVLSVVPIVLYFKRENPDIPLVFWAICCMAGVAVFLFSYLWGGGRNESGILSPYSSIETGIQEMERWKWRLRAKAVKKAVKRAKGEGATAESESADKG